MALRIHSPRKFLNATQFQIQGRTGDRSGVPSVGTPHGGVHTADCGRDPCKFHTGVTRAPRDPETEGASNGSAPHPPPPGPSDHPPEPRKTRLAPISPPASPPRQLPARRVGTRAEPRPRGHRPGGAGDGGGTPRRKGGEHPPRSSPRPRPRPQACLARPGPR